MQVTEFNNKQVDESNFRIQNKYLFLTYRTHLKKDNYIQWFIARSTKKVDFIRLAHETGGEGEYEHTHVLVSYVSAFQTRDCRYFDYNTIHPHIKTLPNKKAFEDAKKYIAKEDPENADLLTKKDIVSNICSQPTLGDAINNYWGGNFTNINGITAIYNLKSSVPKRFTFEPTAQWQLDLVNMCEEDPDPRTIVWYYDKRGNNGKTAMGKWLHINYPNDWLICKDMGTTRDAATIVSNALAKGWTGWGFLLDLPRSAESHTRIYAYLEEIKDGFVTSQKYNGSTHVFDSPHVVVMANWLPQIKCLSHDRWDIRDMGGRRLTLSEVSRLSEMTEELTDYVNYDQRVTEGLTDRPTWTGIERQ